MSIDKEKLKELSHDELIDKAYQGVFQTVPSSQSRDVVSELIRRVKMQREKYSTPDIDKEKLIGWLEDKRLVFAELGFEAYKNNNGVSACQYQGKETLLHEISGKLKSGEFDKEEE